MSDVSERHKETRDQLFVLLNKWRTTSPAEVSDEPVYQALHDHEEAIEAVCQSRLEAYETAVSEWWVASVSSPYGTNERLRAAFARLRELNTERESREEDRP